MFKPQLFLRIQRRQIIKENFLTRSLWLFIVNGFDLEKSEIPLPLFWWPDLTGNNVASSQIKTADLAGGDINIIRSGEIIVVGRPQKSKPIGEDFKYTFPVDEST